METKTITFEGRSYTVPVWVEWVAHNFEDGWATFNPLHEKWGRIFGFGDPRPTGWYGIWGNGGRSIFIDVQPNPQYWGNSLTKV